MYTGTDSTKKQWDEWELKFTIADRVKHIEKTFQKNFYYVTFNKTKED